MGTRKHAPPHDPPAPTGHAHDAMAPPNPGHGFRPGTRNRVMEAQMRAQGRMVRSMAATMARASKAARREPNRR